MVSAANIKSLTETEDGRSLDGNEHRTSVWYADGRTYADYLFADLKAGEVFLCSNKSENSSLN
ncbi:hypothetical protein, partial [Klebsiella pneumoniae]|uniref:hypothetical protein n=1 Tax=Klebsiella pneumoniae TaxID=573 RepID=UPI002769E9AA|nr:hypothetical protein [Klebsiella pneumoniae]